jgi:DNA processing protein
MNNDERIRAIGLALTQSVGWVLIHRLLERFKSLEAIFAASTTELRSVQGIGPQIAANIQAIQLQSIGADLSRFDQQGIHSITWCDAAYPTRFNTLQDRPLVMFWKGEISTADANTIAIVGTREPSTASLQLAREWAETLAHQGWTIVSGLARGIDTEAHGGALAAGGRTLAVLGSGINVIYPTENRKLAAEIVPNGALISELHPDAPPSTTALMRRNRLIASFARAVIVVEAGAASGALHAARFARTLDRPVYVLDNSAGNSALLREFAKLLPDSPADLIAQLESSTDVFYG